MVKRVWFGDEIGWGEFEVEVEIGFATREWDGMDMNEMGGDLVMWGRSRGVRWVRVCQLEEWNKNWPLGGYLNPTDFKLHFHFHSRPWKQMIWRMWLIYRHVDRKENPHATAQNLIYKAAQGEWW